MTIFTQTHVDFLVLRAANSLAPNPHRGSPNKIPPHAHTHITHSSNSIGRACKKEAAHTYVQCLNGKKTSRRRPILAPYISLACARVSPPADKCLVRSLSYRLRRSRAQVSNAEQCAPAKQKMTVQSQTAARRIKGTHNTRAWRVSAIRRFACYIARLWNKIAT